MSGALFLLDVIAFVIVVAWAFTSEKPGQSGHSGLLGLKDDAEEPARPARTTRWKRGPVRPSTPAAPARGQPRLDWRRSAGPRPPQA
jgi:hypothetical protein